MKQNQIQQENPAQENPLANLQTKIPKGYFGAFPDLEIETVPPGQIQMLDKPSTRDEWHGENLHKKFTWSVRLAPDRKAVTVPLGQFCMENEQGIDPRSGTWLISTINNLLSKPTSPLAHPIFILELSRDAAKASFKTLQENNMSLHKILIENNFSAFSYCSEFKPVSVLEPLFRFHSGWLAMKTRLENGSSYPVKEKDEQSIIADLDGFLQEGNHKAEKEDRAPLLCCKMDKGNCKRMEHSTPSGTCTRNPKGRRSTTWVTLPGYHKRKGRNHPERQTYA